MDHNSYTGKEGESLAADFFQQKGYTVLHRNWRYKRMEVDLIASKNNMLYFIEVKTRRSEKFGHPEENVNRKKIRLLIDASAEYLHEYPQWQKIQFDVLSIVLKKYESPVYFHIEDVYL